MSWDKVTRARSMRSWWRYMTDKMLADLADTVRACNDATGHAPLSDTERDLRIFIKRYHDIIANNAEAAKRLKALEQAMDELVGCKWVHGAAVSAIRNRADEIMREIR